MTIDVSANKFHDFHQIYGDVSNFSIRPPDLPLTYYINPQDSDSEPLPIISNNSSDNENDNNLALKLVKIIRNKYEAFLFFFEWHNIVSNMSNFFDKLKSLPLIIWKNIKRIFIWVDGKPKNVTRSDILERGPYIFVFCIKLYSLTCLFTDRFIFYAFTRYIILTALFSSIYLIFTVYIYNIAYSQDKLGLTLWLTVPFIVFKLHEWYNFFICAVDIIKKGYSNFDYDKPQRLFSAWKIGFLVDIAFYIINIFSILKIIK